MSPEVPRPPVARVAPRSLGSVRWRVTVGVVLLFGLAFTGAGALFVRQVERSLVADVERRNTAALEELTDLIQQGELTPNELYRVHVVSEGGTGTRVALPDGSVAEIEGSVSRFYLEAPRPRLVDEDTGLVTDVPLSLFVEPPDDADRSDYSIAETRIRTSQGDIVLGAAAPLDAIRESTEVITRLFWFVLPALLAVVAAAAWWITGRALRPVDAITRRVQEITSSTLHERVPEPGTDDEVDQLARTMNAMLDRLERATARQQQFVSDASHELRSPVASIRAQMEVAMLDPAATDWEHVAAIVLAEDERLDNIVSDLLALARLDEGQAGPSRDVDLDEIVLADAARPRRVPVDRSAVGAARVQGREGELTSVVRNLLDNAVRHARSQVRVSLTSGPDGVLLAVDDDGPGVAPADRDRIFERFTRLEEGRSRDRGGAGLGLAVARRVVEHLGGEVTVVDSRLGGARFVIRLPASADAAVT